jgi:hypothetical protein
MKNYFLIYKNIYCKNAVRLQDNFLELLGSETFCQDSWPWSGSESQHGETNSISIMQESYFNVIHLGTEC